ncbi:MAG: dCTP deaminase [Sphaerochaetaceae bacterium]|jgi:dCTP deaminase
MVINGDLLLNKAPIKDMLGTKEARHGVSHGLSEAGYDIRIKQRIEFYPGKVLTFSMAVADRNNPFGEIEHAGRFILASAIEEFQMPDDLMGIVHDKSTWARQGLSVFNTVIEPGWFGHLTLELVYHGNSELVIPAGSGIAQVVFHELSCRKAYTGKYQGQPDMPVSAIQSK